MTKKILVGVDDSDTAARAAETAATLAQALGGELHVLSAYAKLEVTNLNVGSDKYVFSTEAEASATATGVIAGLRAQFPAVTFYDHSAEGRPAEATLRVAEQIDADLIVVGNKRVQGIARILGSIAAGVAQNASCDVYIAHTHQQ